VRAILLIDMPVNRRVRVHDPQHCITGICAAAGGAGIGGAHRDEMTQLAVKI
jgi:hypothetical protein